MKWMLRRKRNRRLSMPTRPGLVGLGRKRGGARRPVVLLGGGAAAAVLLAFALGRVAAPAFAHPSGDAERAGAVEVLLPTGGEEAADAPQGSAAGPAGAAGGAQPAADAQPGSDRQPGSDGQPAPGALAADARREAPPGRLPAIDDRAAEAHGTDRLLGDGERAAAARPQGLALQASEGKTSLPLALDLLRRAEMGDDGRLHARLPDGRMATLSIDPVLQQKTARILRDYNVPWGASVAVEPATGRILAVAEHERGGSGAGLSARPFAPAASIFKLVTGAALLEAGVSASESVCVHGGLRRLAPAHLKDSPRDNRCVTLSEAMGHSTNAVFAKLAHRHLAPDSLREVAERLLFGRELPLEGGTISPSPLAIPEDDEFTFATTAAGFNTGVRLTPFHGALLAAAIGNGGMLPDARIIDAIDGIPVEGAPWARRILSEEVAQDLGRMMERTITTGTARAAFRERRQAALPGIRVAGKTGSLFENDPFRDATWFVGYAPMEAPSIAVASVVVNQDKWRIRANYLARETLRSYLLGTTPYRPQ